MLEQPKAIEFYTKQARALVVDDNQLNLEITKGLLAGYNMDTELAISGKEAIDLAQKHTYDIIFMDCLMSKMDGVTAMKRIRQQLSECPPMIALTANATVGVKEELKSQGFDDYMSKLISMSVLEQILLTYIPKEKIVLGKKQLKRKKVGKTKDIESQGSGTEEINELCKMAENYQAEEIMERLNTHFKD